PYLPSHGFQRPEAERPKLTWHQHHVGKRQLFVDAILLAHEVNLVMDSLLPREPFGAGAFRSVADHHEPRRNLLLHAVEDLDDILHALDGAKVRQVHE